MRRVRRRHTVPTRVRSWRERAMAELVVMSWNVQNLLPVGNEGGPTSDAE
jgi:hypothetical protein